MTKLSQEQKDILKYDYVYYIDNNPGITVRQIADWWINQFEQLEEDTPKERIEILAECLSCHKKFYPPRRKDCLCNTILAKDCLMHPVKTKPPTVEIQTIGNTPEISLELTVRDSVNKIDELVRAFNKLNNKN